MEDKRLLIELLKEKYQYELSRKNRFDDILSMPVSLLGLVFAGIFYVVNDIYTKHLSSCHKVFFIAILGTMLLCSFFAIVTLVYVFFGFKREYCTFPESDLVVARYKELQSHFATERKSKQELLIHNAFNGDIIKWYVDCNQHNMITNDRRSAALYNFRMLLSVVILLGLILIFSIFIFKVN